MRRELSHVAGHGCLEPGSADGASDRAACEIEAADELEPFLCEHFREVGQRDSGLNRDRVAVDLEHSIHRGEIELRAPGWR